MCTCKSCDVNPDKCYRSSQLAPLVHTDEISQQVYHFSVSGVSVPQEASTKPAANVYYGVESDDSEGMCLCVCVCVCVCALMFPVRFTFTHTPPPTGNIEWEAAEPTLFPRSLLPLIRFVIMSLTPHYSSPTSSQPHTSTSSQEDEEYTCSDIVELARNIVWTCMVEDARLFFRPLLNQFNRLYKLITDKNCKSSQVDQLLVSSQREAAHHMIVKCMYTHLCIQSENCCVG